MFDANGVRDTAIRCVRELGLREYAPTIRQYLRDENEVIRIAAIVTLSQWGDEESRPAVEEAAKSGSVRIQRCAKLALVRWGEGTGIARKASSPSASEDSPAF